MTLDGKRIIVTGSTLGIGAGIAEGMLRAGAEVVFNSLETEPPAEHFAAMRAIGPCHYVAADLSTVEGARQIVDDGAACMGGVDCLVTSAGTFIDTSFADTTAEDFQRLFDLNVRGYFFAAQQFAKIVGQRDFDASVICVGSTNCVQAEKESVLYDTSKGAVLMLVRSLAVTLAEQGIRVVGVGPGIVPTRLNDFGHQHNPELLELLEAQIPVGRLASQADVAGAAVFLASDAARYITGHMLYVDGGIVAQQMIYKEP